MQNPVTGDEALAAYDPAREANRAATIADARDRYTDTTCAAPRCWATTERVTLTFDAIDAIDAGDSRGVATCDDHHDDDAPGTHVSLAPRRDVLAEVRALLGVTA